MKKGFKIALCAVVISVLAVTFAFGNMPYEKLTMRTELPTDVREGDVIFQESKSQQSPLIRMGTRSHITHCGIIVMRGGKPYVLETLKTLQLTPLQKFISRGDGYWLKRPKVEGIKIKYGKYLG